MPQGDKQLGQAAMGKNLHRKAVRRELLAASHLP